MDSFDTATRCSCGNPVRVSEGPCYRGLNWTAVCSGCYDGAEDSGAQARAIGRGTTIEAALWAWQEEHDEAHEVEWVLADLFGELAQQVSVAAESARGWALVPVEQCDPDWTSGPGPLVYCAAP